MIKMDNIWKNTSEALKSFADILACNKCGNEPINAVTYTNCGHFFCKQCVGNDIICKKCSTPVQPMEIRSDHMIKSLISYCNNIEQIIGVNRNFQSTTAKVLNTSQAPSTGLKLNSEVRRRRIPQKNIEKKNHLGETALHTACVKVLHSSLVNLKESGENDIDHVTMLLAAGANPNTKDNNNWTPLQEVVCNGNSTLSKLLLESGALPNIPGVDNKTALHEAVIKKSLEDVKLLLQYCAKKDVYDKYGKKPIDYCDETYSEIWNILKDETEMNNASTVFNCTLDHSFSVPHSRNTFVIFPSNLQDANKKRLYQMAMKHKIKIVSSFQSSVTHIVVEANENVVQLSYDIMLAILRGNWLLTSEWFQIAMDVDDILTMDFEPFEISRAPIEGIPKKARENAQIRNPGLFDQCNFYFSLNPKSIYYVNDVQLTKEALERLICEGNGTILKREPHPEDIKDKEQIIPFHIANNVTHPLYKCTHYIIYIPGKGEPRVKYNMPHIKTLPLVWLIECIEKFTLVDPTHLGLL